MTSLSGLVCDDNASAETEQEELDIDPSLLLTDDENTGLQLDNDKQFIEQDDDDEDFHAIKMRRCDNNRIKTQPPIFLGLDSSWLQVQRMLELDCEDTSSRSRQDSSASCDTTKLFV
jgi:hypothetical protein